MKWETQSQWLSAAIIGTNQSRLQMNGSIFDRSNPNPNAWFNSRSSKKFQHLALKFIHFWSRISGLKTANACAIDAIETNVISAAHFMSRGLNRLPSRSKENFRVIAVIRRKRE